MTDSHKGMTMHLKQSLLRFATMSVLACTPIFAKAETLQDALISAYEHSGLLEQNRALLRAADEDVAQAVATLRPVVRWVATAKSRHYTQPSVTKNTASLTIQAEWLLYDFGRTNLRQEALKETVLATRSQLISLEQRVLLDAVIAYMNYRRAVDTAALSTSNVGLITQQLRAVRDRFEVGEVTRTDVALAQARLASAKAQQAKTEGQRLSAAAEFQRAVGRKPGRLSAPRTVGNLPRSVNAALSIARSNHPDMIALQHQISALELSVQRSRLSRAPSINLKTSGTVNDTAGTGIIGEVELTASGVLYSGGALASQTRQAIAQRDAARSQLHVQRHVIDQNVQNAFVSLNVAKAQLQASDQQIKAATIAFRGIREEAALGSRTTLDVLNAEQELLDARTSRIIAEVDRQIAAYSILAATGRLTANSLNLNVKTYDPAQYYDLAKNAPSAQSAQGRALNRVLESIGNN